MQPIISVKFLTTKSLKMAVVEMPYPCSLLSCELMQSSSRAALVCLLCVWIVVVGQLMCS